MQIKKFENIVAWQKAHELAEYNKFNKNLLKRGKYA